MSQLTLDGREVAHPIRRGRLGPTQKTVLRLLALGSMTTGDCEDAVRGGSRAVRRLRDRGLVEKHAGLWFLSRGPFEP